MFNAIKNIHFVGIGGSGMSGIAEVLVNLGYVVSGSDLKKTAVIEKLLKLGVKVFIGHDANHIEDADVLVVSSAIDKHNPEIIRAQSLHIPIIHRSEMLAELMRLKYGIVVAGTHGKTTTTSILASALHHLGLDPTVVIGGKLNAFGSHAKLGSGDLFVAEADESDGSFLRLTPTIAVITNIDKDHLDYYGSLDHIIKAFEAFVDKIPFYGAACLCIDDPIVQLILPKIRRKIITYGLNPDADIQARNIHFHGMHSTYTPVVYGEEKQDVTLNMPGSYNVLNSLATFAVASVLKQDLSQISQAISTFQGVLHRFTPIAEIKGTLLIDDYAHNPKKIETVLKGAKESFPDRQIIAIFQPHRFSRVKIQLEEFARAFSDADKLIITPIYSAGETDTFHIELDNLYTQIKIGSFHNASDSIYMADDFAQATDLCYHIIKNTRNEKGSVVLTLGAGDIRSVGNMLLEKLKVEGS